MRIGIDIRTLMDKRYSGVSNYTLALVKELLEQDKNNSYKLFYNSWQDVSARMPVFNSANAEVVFTQYPNKIFNYALQKTGRWPKIDRLLDVDLFFMPHINFIALSKQCRKIITIHDLSFLRYGEFFSKRKNIWHKIINVKKLLADFDTIIAVSENTKRDLMELLNVPEAKIKVIYSGMNSETGTDVNAVNKKYNLPEKFFLYLGNIEPRKNINAIIQAFDVFIDKYPELNDYQLVLAGEDGWKNKNIFSSISSAKHQDKIILLGYIDEVDKNALYKRAAIFIYPSFYEGFGFPILEAMAVGTPVITSPNSSLPEVAKNAAIFVNPFNINELVNAIHAIVVSNNIKQKLAEESLLIKNMFSWQKAGEKYLQIFS